MEVDNDRHSTESMDQVEDEVDNDFNHSNDNNSEEASKLESSDDVEDNEVIDLDNTSGGEEEEEENVDYEVDAFNDEEEVVRPMGELVDSDGSDCASEMDNEESDSTGVDGEQEDNDMELSDDEIGHDEDNATEGKNGVKSNESDRDDDSEGSGIPDDILSDGDIEQTFGKAVGMLTNPTYSKICVQRLKNKATSMRVKVEGKKHHLFDP